MCVCVCVLQVQLVFDRLELMDSLDDTKLGFLLDLDTARFHSCAEVCLTYSCAEVTFDPVSYPDTMPNVFLHNCNCNSCAEVHLTLNFT
jgi:hypothetical protein